MTGVFAATRVSVLEGNGLQHTEAWAAIRANEVLVFPTDSQKPKEKLTLSEVECYGMLSTPSAHPTKVLRHPDLNLGESSKPTNLY